MKQNRCWRPAGRGWTEEDIGLIASNPYHCLEKVDPAFARDHETLIDEEQFIRIGKRMIEEKGAEWYLRLLLENLKGNFLIVSEEA
jgi:hypothetical protein